MILISLHRWPRSASADPPHPAGSICSISRTWLLSPSGKSLQLFHVIPLLCSNCVECMGLTEEDLPDGMGDDIHFLLETLYKKISSESIDLYLNRFRYINLDQISYRFLIIHKYSIMRNAVFLEPDWTGHPGK